MSEIKGYMPMLDDIETLAEIDLRGRFIMMACDIEWSMLHIIMSCAPDPLNQSRKFTGQMMHSKIEMTICDLKNNKPHLYEEYKDELEKLWEFKEVRNDLAHYKLQFVDGTKFKEFRFWLIQPDATGEERLHYKPYTIEYFKECLTKFIDLNLTMAKLVEKLREELPPNARIQPVVV